MQPVDFIHQLGFAGLPAEVVDQAKRCVLDLTGVAAAGLSTPLSRTIRNHAAEHFAPGQRAAGLLFDGRKASPVGAALANGMTIDAYDAHDGHPLTKGHAGAGVLSALLAFVQAEGKADGRDFLTALVLGYELGVRAGMALHQTVRDYHTSGAWVAVACAALGARQLGIGAEATRHALGIAEYHGPRSQMMRCIDHPTMVKDGSGWGAMAGVSAAYLAADGFTGAPAVTVEGAGMAALWSDLGSRWRIMEQYFKPYPVCRWGQPAVEAVLSVMRTNRLTSADVERVEIETFYEAARLTTRRPANTEEAQYSLSFPVAAAIVRGVVGPAEIGESGMGDATILRLSEAMTVREDVALSARFPGERWARARLVLKDGRRLDSGDMQARGDAERPLADEEISAKFRRATEPVLGRRDSARLLDRVAALDSEDGALAGFLELLFSPAGSRAAA